MTLGYELYGGPYDGHTIEQELPIHEISEWQLPLPVGAPEATTPRRAVYLRRWSQRFHRLLYEYDEGRSS